MGDRERRPTYGLVGRETFLYSIGATGLLTIVQTFTSASTADTWFLACRIAAAVTFTSGAVLWFVGFLNRASGNDETP